MHKMRYIFVLLLGFSSLVQAKDNYFFTPLENEMDRIANVYSKDTSDVLTQMSLLLSNSPSATPDEKALFLTYDCALRANLASTLAQERLSELNKLATNYSENASVRAASALCEANIATFKKDTVGHEKAIYKAFLFAQAAELATLRYWISLNIYSVFTKYNDYQNAEKALKIGLKVAKDNRDQFRLFTTNQLLAEHNLKTKNYDQALLFNDAAQHALSRLSDKWYQGELFSNRAKILSEVNEFNQAIEFYEKAQTLAKRNAQYRVVQFLSLDIAYIKLRQKHFSEAKAIIDQVKQYSLEYDDVYLINQTSLYESYYLITLGSTEHSTAQDTFKHVTEYLAVNNYSKPLQVAWQQLATIAEENNAFDISYQAQRHYFNLYQESLTKESYLIQSRLIDAYNSMRRDDQKIANEKLEEAASTKNKLHENRQMLIIGVLLLATLLTIVLAKFIWALMAKYKQKKIEINRQLFYDPLTECYNRRYFNDHITKRLISDSIAKKTSYLLLIDIDYFKKFNDLYGHSAGDKVLKELVSNLQSDSRFSDNVVRLGGEEFLIILPPNDNLMIESVIERILRFVAQSPVVIEDKPRNITISMGFVPVEKANCKSDIDDLLNLADKALYIAKRNGRNRALGVSDLQCPANYIDKILIANENKLLKLTEITPQQIPKASAEDETIKATD